MRSLNSNRVKQFVKDYRLPLWSTVGLVLILILLLLLRTYERGVLAGALGDSNTKNGDYANLINGDKEAELKKKEVGSEDAETKATTNKSAATATSSPSTSLTLSSDGDTTTPQPGEPSSPTPNTGPFSAQIRGFEFQGQSNPFLCDSSFEGPESMCKQYAFAAGISTFNGPGTVNFTFKWQGQASGESLGSFEASIGDTITRVNKQISLTCDKPGGYRFQVVLLDPSNAESYEVHLNHDCGNIQLTPGP